jgi:hypothetical protein
MDRIGVRPPTVSLDLDEGATVSLDEVHRAKSILRRHAGEMRRAGKLVEAGEMDQVANVLADTETDWSREAGVYDELMRAKTATADYNETFGREISEPKTKIGEAEKTTNPDFLKEQEEEEQLARIVKRNPDLAKSHERIRAMREQLRSMESEASLQKKIDQEIPEEPSLGDLRGGKYELSPEPKPPKPLEAYPPAAKSPPAARSEDVEYAKPPEREAPPDRPKYKQAGEEELTEANRKKYLETVEYWRRRGILVASFAASVVLGSIVKMKLGTALEDAFGAAITIPTTVYGLTKLAEFMEKPGVMERIIKPSPEEMRQLDRLPFEQRKQVADGFRKINMVATKKGYRVSPLIVAYIAANKGQPQAPDEEQNK